MRKTASLLAMSMMLSGLSGQKMFSENKRYVSKKRTSSTFSGNDSPSKGQKTEQLYLSHRKNNHEFILIITISYGTSKSRIKKINQKRMEFSNFCLRATDDELKVAGVEIKTHD